GKAIEYCRKASQQAVKVYAYDEAEKNLRVALDLVDSEDHELRMVLLEELADVCRLVRRFVEAISVYQDALEVWDTLSGGDHILKMRLNRKIVEIATDAKWSVDAQTFMQVSEVSKRSHASLIESLGTIEGEDPHEETVRMLAALSMDAWRVQDPADWKSAQRYAEQAVELADQLQDQELLSSSLGALATALDGQSLLREHLKIAERRVKINVDGHQVSEHEKIDAQRGMGAALMYVGKYAQALPYLEEAESLAAQVRAPDQTANALGIMAQCLFRMDRWDEVLEVEERWRDLDTRYTRERVGET
ncbi:MAG: tetratricopeptide repeat protein, partial [Anaerolineales bacterium]